MPFANVRIHLKHCIRFLLVSLMLGNAHGSAVSQSHEDLSDALIGYSKLEYAAAFSMLLPLGRNGDPVAQEVLGFMFARGEGRPADMAAAFHWFRLAAEAGRSEAQLALGHFYLDGLATAPDAKQALSWYSRAAAQGSP